MVYFLTLTAIFGSKQKKSQPTSTALYISSPFHREQVKLVPHVQLHQGLALELGWVVDYLSCLDRSPLVSLDPNAQTKQDGCNDNGLDSHLLALIHFRLGSPIQKLNNILSHLRCCCRCLIFVFNQTVKENTRHGNSGAGKVWVEVEPFLTTAPAGGSSG